MRLVSASAAYHVHRDLVSSWWTVALLVVVAALALVWSLVPSRRVDAQRGGRRAQRWTLRGGSLLALVIAVAVGVNAYVGYAPDVEALRLRLGLGGSRPVVSQPAEKAPVDPAAQVATVSSTPPDGAGAVGKVTIPGAADLRMPSEEAWIYTPPGFDPSGQTLYPTLYLFHGSPGSAVDWMASGAPAVLDALITAGQVRPMIVISPDLNASGTSESSCLDSASGGSQVETYLTDVLLPWVDAHYPVATGRTFRAVGGMSSGAFCALDQGLRHNDLYSTILAVMPYGHPGDGGDVLADEASFAAHSPNTYVDSIPLPDPVAVLFDYGEDEGDPEVGETARDLAARLEARGEDVVLRSEPGQAHTWTMAMIALPHGLELFEQHMQEHE